MELRPAGIRPGDCVPVSSVDLTNGKYAPMRLRVPGVSLHLVNGQGKPVSGVVATTGCLQTAQQLFAGGQATGTVCGRATSDSSAA